jgi:transcriptional regulator with XRE-family HTH domain
MPRKRPPFRKCVEIREYRERNNLTQPAFGKKFKVEAVTVYRWESGQRRIDKELVPKISKLTGIPAAVLRPDLAALFGTEADAA